MKDYIKYPLLAIAFFFGYLGIQMLGHAMWAQQAQALVQYAPSASLGPSSVTNTMLNSTAVTNSKVDPNAAISTTKLGTGTANTFLWDNGASITEVSTATAATYLTNLAGSGANTNITSLGGLTTALTATSGGTGIATNTTVQGSVLYTSGTGSWATLNPGTSGQFLKTLGAGGNPAWASVASGLLLTDVNSNTDTNSTAAARVIFSETIPVNTLSTGNSVVFIGDFNWADTNDTGSKIFKVQYGPNVCVSSAAITPTSASVTWKGRFSYTIMAAGSTGQQQCTLDMFGMPDIIGGDQTAFLHIHAIGYSATDSTVSTGVDFIWQSGSGNSASVFTKENGILAIYR